VAEAYARGVSWMAEHPDAAIALTARVLELSPSVAASALARAKLEVFEKSYTTAVVHEHLQERQAFNPELTGGDLPDAAFYR
jgi:ABC-type nitrate/sulfonate/bicarbonate transport system substrate-binding protein